MKLRAVTLHILALGRIGKRCRTFSLFAEAVNSSLCPFNDKFKAKVSNLCEIKFCSYKLNNVYGANFTMYRERRPRINKKLRNVINSPEVRVDYRLRV